MKYNKKTGCNRCSGIYMDTTIFIEKSKSLHNNDFNYKEVIYEKSNIPVKIICNKTNKIF